MVYEENGKAKCTVLSDGTPEALLENILEAMQSESFGRSRAAKIVGGEKRLDGLIRSGDIRTRYKSYKQNSKLFCNASDVLRHAVPKRNRFKKF